MAGGVAPEWMERMRRSTAESLVKSTAMLGATRKTWRFRRSGPVPIAVWIVIVFIRMDT